MPEKVRVWDLPTRFFHWLLACAVPALIVTGRIGGAAMVWHLRLGLLVLALLVAEGLLRLSERYRWFWFNEKKGWTVLTLTP